MKFKYNRDKLKQRLDDLQGNSTSVSKDLWKPETGHHQVRMLPYLHNGKNEDYPWVLVFVHNNLGSNWNIPCLEKNYGEECPICEYAETLIDSARSNKEIWISMKRIEAIGVGYVPVLIRDSKNSSKNAVDEEGNILVKLWKLTKANEEILINYLSDPDNETMFDYQEGFDITVEKEPRVEGDKFSGTTKILNMKRKESSVASNQTETEEIMDLIPKIEDVFPKQSPEVLTEYIKSWLAPKDDSSNGNSSPDDTPFDMGDSPDPDPDVDDKLDKLLNDN